MKTTLSEIVKTRSVVNFWSPEKTCPLGRRVLFLTWFSFQTLHDLSFFGSSLFSLK